MGNNPFFLFLLANYYLDRYSDKFDIAKKLLFPALTAGSLRAAVLIYDLYYQQKITLEGVQKINIENLVFNTRTNSGYFRCVFVSGNSAEFCQKFAPKNGLFKEEFIAKCKEDIPCLLGEIRKFQHEIQDW